MTPPIIENALMTPREAAEYLNIPVSALNRARRLSGLPAVRIGRGVIRYRRESLLAWVEQTEAVETPGARAEKPARPERTDDRPAVSLLD